MLPKNEIVLRYTNLPSALDILTHKRITLLDPKTWEDKNDTAFLSAYQKRMKLKSLLALCMTQTTETFHHWRVFSEGSSGVCIVFNKDKLLSKIQATEGMEYRSVHYRKIVDIENRSLKTKDLPYLKRHPYRDERELRIIYQSLNEEIAFKTLPISMAYIRRVVLSPHLPASLASTMRTVLRSIPGCKSLEITRTTLLENQRWQKVASKVSKTES